ncbi:MAG: protein nirF [Hyphomicrobiaceae bacterium]|nr:MAG: protein nirF [Hyphomicrobiaceae bacterium]
MKRREFIKLALATTAAGTAATRASACPVSSRATGDLGVIVERASGSILIIESTGRTVLDRIEGLGDLSHASVVFSRNERFAYIFGRDGGLTKVDLINAVINRRVVQAGNSIGGAISDDGRLVAVANYEPGGVKLFDSASLAEVGEIAAEFGRDQRSKTVGIADAPGRRFLFSLYDGGEIWLVDCGMSGPPKVTKFGGVGSLPYDGLITRDGRYYLAGLFGEDGLVCLDLWADQPAPRRILAGYGKGEEKLPVYKMPHLRGWAQAGDRFLLPAVGRHEVLVVQAETFQEIGRVAVHGQPVFVMARPDGRHAWVNFAHPKNDVVQVIDSRSLAIQRELRPGPAVLHMEFTGRGHEVWLSVRDADRVDVYDTRTFAKLAELPARKPSGIFFTCRAHRTGF